jgi:hypothetical protein
MLQRYILPLAPYLLIALNSILCLFFFLCLENEIRILKRRTPRPGKIQDSAARDLKTKLEELSLRVHDAEERMGMAVLPPIPKASFNLNKRTQVIRMSRRGEPEENIAASLSIPRKEVELLLKVHRLVLNGPPKLT